jgi:hypothetical protein
MTTKVADSKGRIALGPAFANQPVMIEQIDPTEVRIVAAVMIPKREAWLYENKSALQSVKRGLKQVAAGRYSKKPPNIDADAKIAEQLSD